MYFRRLPSLRPCLPSCHSLYSLFPTLPTLAVPRRGEGFFQGGEDPVSPSLLRLRLRDLALGLLTMLESPGGLGRAPVRRGERYALVTPLKVGGGGY